MHPRTPGRLNAKSLIKSSNWEHTCAMVHTSSGTKHCDAVFSFKNCIVEVPWSSKIIVYFYLSCDRSDLGTHVQYTIFNKRNYFWDHVVKSKEIDSALECFAILLGCCIHISEREIYFASWHHAAAVSLHEKQIKQPRWDILIFDGNFVRFVL